MNQTDAAVETTLRIPGTWHHPRELLAQLPEGFRLTAEALVLPDGSEIEITPLPPDDQFAKIFQSACRRPASRKEMRQVTRYTVNIALTGTGGSVAAALRMMQAGAAIVRAGGAGVFIDNSALAHGGNDWIELTEDGSSDAVSFAFVNIVRGQQELKTMGMRVVGLPDIVRQISDLETDGDAIVAAIRYMCQGVKPVGDGHIVIGEAGPWFQVEATHNDKFEQSSPMHNPFGRLKLVSFKEAANRN
jgi:hypothetical protein